MPSRSSKARSALRKKTFNENRKEARKRDEAARIILDLVPATGSLDVDKSSFISPVKSLMKGSFTIKSF